MNSPQSCHLGLNINHSIVSARQVERSYLSIITPLPTGRMSSQCRVAGIDFDIIIIATEQFILVTGIHPTLHITESGFQFTDIPFNLVDHIGRRNLVRVTPSSFLADLPKSVLFRRAQIFLILIR